MSLLCSYLHFKQNYIQFNELIINMDNNIIFLYEIKIHNEEIVQNQKKNRIAVRIMMWIHFLKTSALKYNITAYLRILIF